MIERCLTGTVLILAILILRAVGAKLLPKRLFCFLWIVAALYLLLPFRIRSEASVYSFVRETLPQAARSVRLQVKTGSTGVIRTSTAAGDNTLVWICWLGRLAAALLLGAAYTIGLYRLNRGEKEQHPYVRIWQLQHPLRRNLRILCSDAVKRPVSGGLLFPVIHLPKDRGNCTDAELECILTHEYLHICHLDSLWKLLYALCLCFYWFHPGVWLLVFLAGRDMEYACDAAVLETGVRPASYCASLIRMELRLAEVSMLNNGFLNGQLMPRVKRIEGYRTKKPAVWVAGACLSAVIILLFATLPPAMAEEPGTGYPVHMEDVGREKLKQKPEPAFSADAPPSDIQNTIDSSLFMVDPYSGYQLLGEISGISEEKIPEASGELKALYSPHLLRITSDGVSSVIRVYDFPED